MNDISDWMDENSLQPADPNDKPSIWQTDEIIQTIKAQAKTKPKMTLYIFEMANDLFTAGRFSDFKQILDGIDPATVPIETSLALNTTAFWAPVDRLDRKDFLLKTAAHYRTLGRDPISLLGGLQKGLDLTL